MQVNRGSREVVLQGRHLVQLDKGRLARALAVETSGSSWLKAFHDLTRPGIIRACYAKSQPDSSAPSSCTFETFAFVNYDIDLFRFPKNVEEMMKWSLNPDILRNIKHLGIEEMQWRFNPATTGFPECLDSLERIMVVGSGHELTYFRTPCAAFAREIVSRVDHRRHNRTGSWNKATLYSGEEYNDLTASLNIEEYGLTVFRAPLSPEWWGFPQCHFHQMRHAAESYIGWRGVVIDFAKDLLDIWELKLSYFYCLMPRYFPETRYRDV
ncbi:hypothetical protein F5Y18DRAFT_359114 [Xylariaceae sp. FL1019]|nr:hypothetical protein F5Y18DRAFT_359114 [Xylariaceae sp. FL1019]